MTEREQYISSIKDTAISACMGTGLFPSLMIAQAIVESGNGKSMLAVKYHNHFGIKALGGWKGKIANMKTREVFDGKDMNITDGFRVYDNLQDGFNDRNKFLKENPRYAKAGVFTAKTPEDQAQAFQNAGYATDPNYAKTLISVINGSGKLKRYDV